MNHSLYTAKQTRELDRIAIEEHKIPGYTLMKRSGKACYDQIKFNFKNAHSIAIMCGLGNNAGDGFVVANLAIKDKKKVSVFLLGDPNKLKGDALKAYKDLLKLKPNITSYSNQCLTSYNLIVDAIFGSGLSRNITGPFKKAIHNISQSKTPVFAIDIPSGINADTGQIMGIAVKARATMSFIGLKQGMFTNDGPEYSGKIYFNDLKVPKDIYKKIVSECSILNFNHLIKKLKPRHKNSHKNDYGHTLVIGGNNGMLGAARLCAEASLRTGSGLVSVGTRKTHAPLIIKWCPEIMSGTMETKKDFLTKLNSATVIALGPGLGQDSWAKKVFNFAFNSSLPLVIDADALNLLAKAPRKRKGTILTPHPGEAARLLNTTTKNIQKDRFKAVKRIAIKYNAITLLKGCGTLITAPQGPIYICTLGNPGMASGGMGDTLTGIIAALIAQNLSLIDAACLGACLHAKAADLAAKNSERGLIASDLFEPIRKLVNPILIEW